MRMREECMEGIIVMKVDGVIIETPFVDIFNNSACGTTMPAGDMNNLWDPSIFQMRHRSWYMRIFNRKQSFRTSGVVLYQFFDWDRQRWRINLFKVGQRCLHYGLGRRSVAESYKLKRSEEASTHDKSQYFQAAWY